MSKLSVTNLCAGNSPVTGEFPAQMTSNAENVSIWWRHHEKLIDEILTAGGVACDDTCPVSSSSSAYTFSRNFTYDGEGRHVAPSAYISNWSQLKSTLSTQVSILYW